MVLTQSRIDFSQCRTYFPQTYAKHCGRRVRVRSLHPIRFPGNYPRSGHETGQQYDQGCDAERDACPRHVLRYVVRCAHIIMTAVRVQRTPQYRYDALPSSQPPHQRMFVSSCVHRSTGFTHVEETTTNIPRYYMVYYCSPETR